MLSPQAGALFGYELLWLVLVSHLFKYPAFEFGPRYAAATGQNLLQGYARMPGPRGWPLWIFLVSTVLQGIGVPAAVVSVSGCLLHTWFGFSHLDPATAGHTWLALSHLDLFSLAVIVTVVALLLAGGFNWLDNLNKVMMAVLALATVLAFFASPPDPGAALQGLVVPWLSAGSIGLVAAILGWMPTGIDVSVWHSFWTLEKLDRLQAADSASGDRSRFLRLSLTDMRVGYGLSVITGMMFICLGAVHLGGLQEKMQGVQFADAISTAYTAILGRWMYHVFMLTAFFAMFSTSYVVLDGFSRSFTEALAALAPERLGTPPVRRITYWGFVFTSSGLAAATLVLHGNPVTLVGVVALISLTAAPVLYALNLSCVNRDITDPALRPARATMIIGWAGVALMLLALVVTFYVKVLR